MTTQHIWLTLENGGAWLVPLAHVAFGLCPDGQATAWIVGDNQGPMYLRESFDAIQSALACRSPDATLVIPEDDEDE